MREMPSIIYNVKIGGKSIGLTFSKQRADSWVKASTYEGKKEIFPMKYTKPSAATEVLVDI